MSDRWKIEAGDPIEISYDFRYEDEEDAGIEIKIDSAGRTWKHRCCIVFKRYAPNELQRLFRVVRNLLITASTNAVDYPAEAEEKAWEEFKKLWPVL